MIKTNEQLLANLRIASPCTARWEDMEGDERSRFCRQCTKHVYNFSEMTAQETADLIREREGQLCARFYQRADGTVLTADCPVGAARPLHRLKQFISAAAACLCLSGSSALAGEKPRSPVASQRALLGEVCIQPPKVVATSNTNLPPMLGKICVQPPLDTNSVPAM
jgi:hypothetical protein